MGARIGYFQGDVKKLVDDIATLRPTLFIGTHLWQSAVRDRQHFLLGLGRAGCHSNQS